MTSRPSRHGEGRRRGPFARESPRVKRGYHYYSEDALKELQLGRLPLTADEFHELRPSGWEAILLLLGSSDPQSPLGRLVDHKNTIVREIYSYFFHPWAKHVRLTIPAPLVGNTCGSTRLTFVGGRKGWKNQARRIMEEDVPSTSQGQDGFVSFAKVGQVVFPEPADRNVNMMPFLLGDKSSLPEELQCYHEIIEQCPYFCEEIGKVAYLTVQESFVDAQETQRRPGLHIESPGVFSDSDSDVASFTPGVEHPWGMGVFFGPDRYEGGIYIASSVSNTTQLYDALVDASVPGIVDRWGGCEHLRALVGPGTPLEAGELVWMTDRTPHEALAQPETGHRQFFRLVMPYVSHWFADHSTPNPKVPLPEHVKVVRGNKFLQTA